MQEELIKAYQDVWEYLEAGEWLNASIAAANLAGLDPANKEYSILAKYIRKINDIADKVQGGSSRGAVASLAKISRALPRLKELSSFQTLVEAVAESARRSSRKMGVFISIVVAIAFALVCNLAGYKYLQTEPPPGDLNVMMRTWLGIKKLNEPVDVLLLGDSSCLANLASGPVADRLGGSVINLGNNAGSSLLTDAWMLSAYIKKYGAPKTVVITRTSGGYSIKHGMEFMANSLLPWGYWDDYGVAPVWSQGEIVQLFIKKYGTLYFNADILKERLLKAWNLFDYGINPNLPSHDYYINYNQPKQVMDISTRMPASYFQPFRCNVDNANAIRYMVNVAREYHFQLYFTLPAEWDEAVKAGLRSEQIAAEKEYLSRFTDETYVHIVDQVPKTLFTTDQMQSPNHLWKGSAKIYTEDIVNGIIAVQNKLTAGQAKNLELTSVSLDKDSYRVGDQVSVIINVTDPGDVKSTDLKGSVSCLVKPSGKPDDRWIARAPALDITLNGDEVKEINLCLTAGTMPVGTYDLVVFLRQDVGNLSHETRIEIPKNIKVNSGQ
jgi:hypothetical protein